MSGSATAIADPVFNIVATLFMLELSRIFLCWAKEDCKKEKTG